MARLMGSACSPSVRLGWCARNASGELTIRFLFFPSPTCIWPYTILGRLGLGEFPFASSCSVSGDSSGRLLGVGILWSPKIAGIYGQVAIMWKSDVLLSFLHPICILSELLLHDFY
ncbi:hypothetical protein AVEN_252706-1 [Araneus ventricosus]|uniref:Uncharacterized protein n=1 Tax=Araneus ventricosus TaxID=182803 RepID=A0A4Y2GNS3_ARAVE|nr:hypothetical protein AVEN_252706-1 [Araneus ventricosus]